MTTIKDISLGRAQMPAGTNDILNTRTLRTAHRRLVDLLQPGLSVLDIGCGTGAITRGIAELEFIFPSGTRWRRREDIRLWPMVT